MNLSSTFEIFGIEWLRVLTFLFLVILPLGLSILWGFLQEYWRKVGNKTLIRKILIPAFVCFGIGLVFLILSLSFPVRAHIYAVNMSDTSGSVWIDNAEIPISAGKWEKVYVRDNAYSRSLRASLNGKDLLREDIEDGIYVVNLSDDVVVLAEELQFANFTASIFRAEPEIFLIEKGLQLLCTEVDLDVHDFGTVAPTEIAVSSQQIGPISHWDLSLLGPEEAKMLKIILEKESENDSTNDFLKRLEKAEEPVWIESSPGLGGEDSILEVEPPAGANGRFDQ